MKLKITKQVNVEAKTLTLYMKVRDEFSGVLRDQDKEILSEYEGYVPRMMPHFSIFDKDQSGDHYGDYLILDIDVDTGQILNWQKNLKDEDFDRFFEREE